MHLCFTNFIKITGCNLEDASIMTSNKQSKYLWIEKLVEIKEGYHADNLVLYKELNIKETNTKGNTLYRRGDN